jgi:hypothetical protein
MGREDAKLLEMILSHFAKKLRIEKPDNKLLEMLLAPCFKSVAFG